MKIMKKHASHDDGVQPYWGLKDIPDLSNKTFLITGATNTYGRLIIRAIYANNGSVIMVDEAQQAGYDLIQSLKETIVSTGTLQFRQLDLSDTNAIQKFAADLQNEIVQLDVLINNASIKKLERRQVNTEGVETHFQYNFFGPFVLTNLLLPLLQMGENPRIVNVSAPLPAYANLKLNDLQLENNYSNQRAYLQSKLATQMVTFYLQNISEAQMLGVKVMTAHAGIHRNFLAPATMNQSSLTRFVRSVINPLIGTNETGVLPILFAAIDEHAKGGALYTPAGFLHSQGRPQATRPIAAALDKQRQSELWVTASELAGFSSWASMANSF
ncbi:SDR family NAD(P)-dependent oxidoreductase [Agrilactobacillus yilanensis]|uniref:SDR family NAD(P)-dependent oxidoreductase n=1 Tax=Agrilactobacillus yilanensis TaxID=2485997 RepID=A0ABW4J7H3_9LACO|nr:SDR family NAD(P)-dependent oxidoreductase [Agrilactobacillus yilanensis]